MDAPVSTTNLSQNIRTLRSSGLTATCIAYLASEAHANLVYFWETGLSAPAEARKKIALAAQLGRFIEAAVGLRYFPLFLYSNLSAARYRMPVEVIRTAGTSGKDELLAAAQDFTDTVKLTRPNPYPPRLREYNIKRIS